MRLRASSAVANGDPLLHGRSGLDWGLFPCVHSQRKAQWSLVSRQSGEKIVARVRPQLQIYSRIKGNGGKNSTEE